MNRSLPFYISRSNTQALDEAFGKVLKNPASFPLVFQISGVGGVGKTTLTRKLQQWYKNDADFTVISFGLTRGVEKPIQVMDKLYKALPEIRFLEKNLNELTQKDPFKELYQTYRDTVNKLETEPIEGKKKLIKNSRNRSKKESIQDLKIY